MGVNHTMVTRQTQWCIGVFAVVIRQYALKNCLWQMFVGLEMESNHEG